MLVKRHHEMDTEKCFERTKAPEFFCWKPSGFVSAPLTYDKSFCSPQVKVDEQFIKWSFTFQVQRWWTDIKTYVYSNSYANTWASIYDMGTSQNLDAINCNDFLPKWYHFRANRRNLMLWHTKGLQDDTPEKFALMLEWRKPMKYPMISISYKIILQLWDTVFFASKQQTSRTCINSQTENQQRNRSKPTKTQATGLWNAFRLPVLKPKTDA